MIGLLGDRLIGVIGLSGYWAIRLSGYRAIGLSDYRTIRLSSYRPIAGSAIGPLPIGGQLTYRVIGTPRCTTRACRSRAALLYSMVQSCAFVGVPPVDYLKDVLLRVATHPQRLIGQLTPKARAETFRAVAAV